MRSQCMNEHMDKFAGNGVLLLIPAMDRIIFKLHGYGLSSRDIAVVVNSTEESIDDKLSLIKKTLNEFMEYANN